MKKYIVTAFILMMHITMCVAQIGTWKNYLAYYEVQQIQEAGNYLFVQASNGLYQYNKQDQSIVTYDKVNGLSDTYITHIKWCQQAKRLIAVYQNCNIDLVETSGDITNISAIYTKAITGDKSINSIYIYNEYAYLACGFGIVKLNVKKAEISESYMLDITIKAITIDGNNIYAQASDGTVWTASLSSNLIDKSNWSSTTTYPSFEEDMKDYHENIDVVKTLSPGGPKYNYFGFMKFMNGKLYTCNGDFSTSSCIQVLENTEWDIYQDEDISTTTGVSYQGLVCLDIDPLDNNHLFAGGRNGLYEFKNSKFVKYYDYTNSPIESYNNKSKEYQLVSGVKYDTSGNLWILNSQAPTASLIQMSSTQFTKYNKSELMKLNDGGFTNKSNGNLINMIIDSYGKMWFVNDHWMLPALYQYDISNDAIKAYESFVNQDGTNISMYNIHCVTEDLSKNIWIGTNVGPLMLERSEINNDGSVFTQVKVPRNDGTSYADYLLSGININCIAIDGAGRKWFGTEGNGVYLISADNMQQLQHFTVTNSSLLSNNIKSITIHPTSGKVFFGTENGLCSYMSDAVTASDEMTKDNVWAYPNPVSPYYTGLITITGLTLNADVKILSSSGILIKEGRSNGGSFTWDGCDKNGNRVGSGIYMVATATSDGNKGIVCKIAIVK